MSSASRKIAKFAFIVHDNGLDAGAPGNEPLRPRLAAARIRLDQKAGINQRDASRFAELQWAVAGEYLRGCYFWHRGQ
jgi:hypothetical protein